MPFFSVFIPLIVAPTTHAAFTSGRVIHAVAVVDGNKRRKLVADGIDAVAQVFYQRHSIVISSNKSAQTTPDIVGCAGAQRVTGRRHPQKSFIGSNGFFIFSLCVQGTGQEKKQVGVFAVGVTGGYIFQQLPRLVGRMQVIIGNAEFGQHVCFAGFQRLVLAEQLLCFLPVCIIIGAFGIAFNISRLLCVYHKRQNQQQAGQAEHSKFGHTL